MKPGQRWFVGWLLVALFAAYLWSAAPLHAGTPPVPIFPIGMDIAPEGATPIQMTYELVSITVRDFQETDRVLFKFFPNSNKGVPSYRAESVKVDGMAAVQADFFLLNPTENAITTTVMFPLSPLIDYGGQKDQTLPRIENFQVSVQGTLLTPQLYVLPSPVFAGSNMAWAFFPVNVPAGQVTRIHVGYDFPLNRAADGFLWDLHYGFETGAAWAGPIGKIELMVNLPYEVSPELIFGYPSGATFEGNQVRWTWENLEPTAEHNFSVNVAPAGLVQQIQNAEKQVQLRPEDGEAWLALADAYFMGSHAIPCGETGPRVKGVIDPSLVAQTYAKAAALLPTRVKPHLCMAFSEMFKYEPGQSLSLESAVWTTNELDQAFELHVRYAQPDTYDLNAAVSFLKKEYGFKYLPKVTFTPTPSQTPTPTQTPTPRPTSTRRPTATPKTSTPTPWPSKTPNPSSVTLVPTPTATPTAKPVATLLTSTGRLIFLVVGLSILGGAGYWFLRRRGAG